MVHVLECKSHQTIPVLEFVAISSYELGSVDASVCFQSHQCPLRTGAVEVSMAAVCACHASFEPVRLEGALTKQAVGANNPCSHDPADHARLCHNLCSRGPFDPPTDPFDQHGDPWDLCDPSISFCPALLEGATAEGLAGRNPSLCDLTCDPCDLGNHCSVLDPPLGNLHRLMQTQVSYGFAIRDRIKRK